MIKVKLLNYQVAKLIYNGFYISVNSKYIYKNICLWYYLYNRVLDSKKEPVI